MARTICRDVRYARMGSTTEPVPLELSGFTQRQRRHDPDERKREPITRRIYTAILDLTAHRARNSKLNRQ